MRYATIFIVMTLCTSGANAQSIAHKAESAMKRVFGESLTQRSITLSLDRDVVEDVREKTGESIGNKVIVHEALRGTSILGYGIVDDVPGKAQPITYMTLIRPDGAIADVEVLIYREPYGGEVQNETFRRQFRGKHSASPIRVGKDIQNIAGATISSKAIANGARKILALFNELKHAGKI